MGECWHSKLEHFVNRHFRSWEDMWVFDNYFEPYYHSLFLVVGRYHAKTNNPFIFFRKEWGSCLLSVGRLEFHLRFPIRRSITKKFPF